MKRTLLLLTFLFAFQHLTHAQADTITTAQAKDYMGKEVVLKGKLLGIKPYIDKNGQDILFLDIDDRYPNTAVSVTVFSDAMPNIKLTAADINKTIYISGELTLYRDKPSITISDARQVSF
jgi:DNA polymerase III alpha subunit